jgi:hypothetical protein
MDYKGINSKMLGSSKKLIFKICANYIRGKPLATKTWKF